ncbi:MAG: DNA polymerase I [Fidelibacterota bacterium]
MSSPDKKRLFLIDGYAMVYRAHFAMIRNPLLTSDGRHTSALFGFINSIFKILRDEKPDYLAAVFDAEEKTFRHKMYPQYKATREKMPDELREQLPELWRLIEALNIPQLVMPGFEADDIIGALAITAKKQGIEAYIVSGDKDFMQLVNDHIFLYTPGRQGASAEIVDRQKVEQKWKVQPEQIIDLLSLMGDSSDNVPGVMGIGEKTAVALLQEYGDLDTVLANAEQVKNKRAREGLLNNADIAYLSRDLVTIKTDLPLTLKVDDLKRKSFNFDAVTEIFRKLEFVRLLDQLNEFKTEEAYEDSALREKKYALIDSQDKLVELVRKLKNAELVSLDLETTSQDPMRAEIVGFSYSIEPHTGWYIPVQFPEKEKQLFEGDNDLDTVLKILKPILEDDSIAKCGQHLKYDCLILKNHGIEVAGIEFDTLLAAHLLQPAARSYKLDYLSEEYLRYRMQPILDLIGSGKNQISMADVALDKIAFYAAEDADVVIQLVSILRKKLIEMELVEFMRRVELPLIPSLLQMEQNGVYVDSEMMGTMSRWMEKKLDAFRREIFTLAGMEFNLNSTQQLATILFDHIGLKPVRKRSTNVTVLEKLKNEHPLPGMVLDYRKFQKLKSTYVDAIPKLVHPQTGRIHSSFSQTVAATGRLASSNPNFQNIPIRTEEGREIRKAFRPQEKGWQIFSADYSQIELRIMAHLSGDKVLKEAFERGEDIHARTASDIYGVPLDDVLPEMRRMAKVVNFGVMYGAGPYRLSQEFGMSLSEADQIIGTYFNRYSGIKSFIDKTLTIARDKKFVTTMLGRKRFCYDIDHSNSRVRMAAERATINHPIQGTAAEMIKLAMITIDKKIKSMKLRSKMILQIHDELLFEVPQEELDDLKSLVVEEMESALPLNVPVVVDCGAGESWYEAH